MVIGVAFVAGVFYSVGLLLPTPIQLCRKNKKKRSGEKGADFPLSTLGLFAAKVRGRQNRMAICCVAS